VRQVTREVQVRVGGSPVYTLDALPAGAPVMTTRQFWEIDFEIPTFTQDRAYIEDLLKIEDAA
jgi:hypothetical protein